MKNFVWRAAREILSNRETLCSRGIEVLSSCIHCPNEFDNSWHLFIGCNYAQCCWQHAGLNAVVYLLMNDAGFFLEWLFTVLKSVKESVLGKVMIILWSLWREWNERLWNNVSYSHVVVIYHGLEFLTNWIQVRVGPDQSALSVGDPGCLIWHPPLSSYFKYNCDAATFHDIDSTGAGMVLRNKASTPIRFKMLQVPSLADVKKCESLALLNAIGAFHEV